MRRGEPPSNQEHPDPRGDRLEPGAFAFVACCKNSKFVGIRKDESISWVVQISEKNCFWELTTDSSYPTCESRAIICITCEVSVDNEKINPVNNRESNS